MRNASAGRLGGDCQRPVTRTQLEAPRGELVPCARVLAPYLSANLHSLDGGLEGSGNELLLRHDGVIDGDVPNAKVFRAKVKAGDAYVLRSGGGGGFGSPLERPAEKVQNDARQGYVSIGAARDYYGVVLDPDTLAIDDEATARQRADLVEVHRNRIAERHEPPRRIERSQLDQMTSGHLAIRCLLPSCCGRWHMPRGFEAVAIAP